MPAGQSASLQAFLQPDAGPECAMTIVVAPDCMMKDVRALIAIQNLEALGTIRSMQPSKDDIDEGKFDGTVHLTIASDAGEEALKTAALGTEIASVEIQQLEKPDSLQQNPVWQKNRWNQTGSSRRPRIRTGR